MEYKALTGTGLTVSRLCLGTMMFGGQTDEKTSLEIMDCAFDGGINFFDTANTYTGSESERIVGKGLKGRREKIILATKVSNKTGEGVNDGGLSRRSIIIECENSLRRLGTDYIDIYYLHKPDNKTPFEETLDTMTYLIRQGKIRYIGVSNFAAWQYADMLALCDKRNLIAPALSQNVYNLLTRGIEDELMPFSKAHSVGLVVYNPIAAGLLSGKHKPGAPAENTRFSNSGMYYERYWSDENFKAVEKLEEIAAQYGITLLELAMKWCLSNKSVDSVLTGVSRLSQIRQNLGVTEGEGLSGDVLQKCDEVWLSLAGTRFRYNR